jgi:PAS domain S-box-containing protein
MPLNNKIKLANIGFLVTLTFIIYIGFFLFNSFDKDKKGDELLNHSFEVVATSRQLLSTIKDAESAQRGYVITDNPKFLEPLVKSVALKDSLMTRLTVLVSKNPLRMAQVELLKDLVRQKYQSIDHTLLVKKEKGQKAAVAIINLGRGRLLMESIRGKFEHFDKEENKILHQCVLNSQTSHKAIKKILLVGNWSLVFIFSLLFYYLFKQLRRVQQNEELLFVQNEWHNQTLISMGDAVITTDTNGIITMLNNAATQITGWATKEAVGRSIPQVVSLLNAITDIPLQGELLRVLKEKKSLHLNKDIVLIRRDATKSFIESNGAPIRNKKGKIIGAVYIIRDINDRVKVETERYEATQKIESARKKFFQILESNPVAISITEVTSRKIKYVNEAFCLMSGYTREMLLGHNAGDFNFMHHDDRDAKVRTLKKNKGKARNIEAKFHKSDGSSIDVLFYVDTLEVDNVLCHSSNIIDITHKKQLEDKIVKLNQTLEKRVKVRTEALEQQKNFTENILNKISTEIIVYDKNRKYLYANTEAFENKELRQWVIGKTDYDYCAFLGIDDCLAVSRTKAFDGSKKQEDNEWVDEIPLGDGRIKYMLRILHPIPNDDKYILTGYDITHIKQAALASEEYTQNLEHMMAMTSHQVRHAVAQILGLKNLLHDELSQEELQTVIGYMNTSIDSLAAYTHELTDFIYAVKSN